MTSLHASNPGIWCKVCGEPCRPAFIAGQCGVCGKFLCKSCVADHPCKAVDRDVVRAAFPEIVQYESFIRT